MFMLKLYLLVNFQGAAMFQHSLSIFQLHFWLELASIPHFAFLILSDAIPGTITFLATSCFCLVLIWKSLVLLATPYYLNCTCALLFKYLHLFILLSRRRLYYFKVEFTSVSLCFLYFMNDFNFKKAEDI